MVNSPDDYRKASGYRRNEARPLAAAPSSALSGPIVAYDTLSLGDPRLLDMMRNGRMGVSGIAVNENQALRNSTFFRALSIISGSIGMLPLHLYKREGETTSKAKEHPLFNLLHRRPNKYQTASKFRSYMQTCALLDGAAYALKVKSRGAVRQLVPLKRGSVKPELSNSFELQFRYSRPNGGQVILSADDVFHFSTPLSLDGLNGVSLLDVAADTLGLALKAQRAAGRLMTKGSMARGALETEVALGEEAVTSLRESLSASYADAGSQHDWLILEEGLKAKPFGTSARDSQLIELMKREAEEVARFTGVPRPLLMFDETSWGSGIEQLGLFFVTYCLLPWFVIWEEAIWTWLLTPAEQETHFAKFNEGALLRGSQKDQAEFIKAALGPNNGYLSQNEAREFFDRNPKEGGDELPRPGTTAHAMTQEKVTDA